jgi:hypothetical protein
VKPPDPNLSIVFVKSEIYVGSISIDRKQKSLSFKNVNIFKG